MDITPVAAASPIWTDVAIFIALLFFSSFFSASETALTGASRARLTALEERGNHRAGLVNRLREKKEALIGGLLLGNNFVNIFASAIATSVMMRLFGENGVALATIGVTILVLIFAEVIPKTYALLFPDRLSLLIVRPVSIVVAVCSPITMTVSKIVNFFFHLFGVDKDAAISATAHEEELRGAIALFNAYEPDADQQKGMMLRSILDLADVSVESVMIHRRNVRMISADWPLEKIVDEVLHSPFTRFPVWKETPDNIIGILHAKLVLNELRAASGDADNISLINTLMEPWFIPDTTILLDQMQAFRDRREHFALVVDEYGSLMGIVTLEDILEEIVGQIDDEYDVAVPGLRPQVDGSYIADGKVTIRDLNREMNWRLPDEEYDTLAGLLLYESQRIPAIKQKYRFFGFTFEIIKKQRNQITQVKVIPPQCEVDTVSVAQ
ncbi:MAG: HlyC/CorC family transporter [Alphaproteobacteria bacterium]|nr:HlyC/CorC family transporter [Alphaproteobacteria bacterium]